MTEQNKKDIESFERCLTDKCVGCENKTENDVAEGNATCHEYIIGCVHIPFGLAKRILLLLKEQESILGINIDTEGIRLTATGDEKKGEELGLMMGKAIMLERIERGLLLNGLLSEEIKDVLRKAKRE